MAESKMAELKMAEFKMAAIIKFESEWMSLGQGQSRGRVFLSESERR